MKTQAPHSQASAATKVVLPDDEVRIERVLPVWSDTCLFLAVGKAGQCYNREGKRTYLFCFDHGQLSDTPKARDFSWESREELEHFLAKLPEMRNGGAK